ncbi:MAG: hypothetical protein IH985_05455 [Planctomycetes bacterium]|nr:hypothetical protein [Planctomycetota bacterium]
MPATNLTDAVNALFSVAPADQWQPVIDRSGVALDLAFNLRFVAQDFPCYADCDQSTGVGTLDIFNFLRFQNSLVAGCRKANPETSLSSPSPRDHADRGVPCADHVVRWIVSST